MGGQEFQRVGRDRGRRHAVDEMAITDQWKIMGGLRYDPSTPTPQSHVPVALLTDEALSLRAAGLPAHQGADLTFYGTVQPPRRPRVASNNTEPEKNETLSFGAKGLFNGALAPHRGIPTYKNMPAPPTRSKSPVTEASNGAGSSWRW
jgi:hypothetical protein